MSRISFLTVGFFTALLGNLPAQLQWEQVKHEGEIPKGQSEATYAFPFTNAGDYAVTITDTNASCGCVVPALAKKTYEPGESGEITATFKVGDRTGKQEKDIRVLTDDPQSNRRLSIAVTIPEFVRITPSFVHWTPAERNTTKTITITHNSTPAEEQTPYTLTATDPTGNLNITLEPLLKDEDGGNAPTQDRTDESDTPNPDTHWLLHATPNPDKVFQSTRVKGKIHLKFQTTQPASPTETDHTPTTPIDKRPHTQPVSPHKTEQILYLLHFPQQAEQEQESEQEQANAGK